jgi:hypothetical protein
MASAKTRSASSERRANPRCKITQLMRIRPSNPANEPFEDLRRTVSVSRSGLYFHTTELSYEVGMRLFVTIPYFSVASAMTSHEYLAEVVRKDTLPGGMTGVGFKTLLEIKVHPTRSKNEPYSSGSAKTGSLCT